MARLMRPSGPPASAPPARLLQWVNTPVLAEAMARYERGDLPRSLRLWIEGLLELDPVASGSGAAGSGLLRAQRH
ncbi:MAG: hypothetical protein VKI83_06275 [Synechococcaceae cyanobacterium]|nr:hypothetical protein [Synechococcaceae cyanobacterium]